MELSQLVGTQIRRKKRKLKGWDLEDDDDYKEHVEYPISMNELDQKMESAPASTDSSDSE